MHIWYTFTYTRALGYGSVKHTDFIRRLDAGFTFRQTVISFFDRKKLILIFWLRLRVDKTMWIWICINLTEQFFL